MALFPGRLLSVMRCSDRRHSDPLHSCHPVNFNGSLSFHNVALIHNDITVMCQRIRLLPETLRVSYGLEYNHSDFPIGLRSDCSIYVYPSFRSTACEISNFSGRTRLVSTGATGCGYKYTSAPFHRSSLCSSPLIILRQAQLMVPTRLLSTSHQRKL